MKTDYKPYHRKHWAEYIIPAILFIAGVLGMFLLFSCSAVKKVNKSEKKQLQVIANYKEKHPAHNDTTYEYKKGDTATQTVTRIDTINRYIKSPSDTVPVYIKQTVTITKTVKDTVLKTIIDRSGEIALQNLLYAAKVEQNKILLQVEADKKRFQEEKKEFKFQIAELKHKLNKWKLYFFILLAVNALYSYFKIRKLFKF